ncbi:MAG: accessory gene regulator B family protein, partial [Clostridium sp.]|uniref:accessory gene regulator B family protein n=1 Tax=Clostridium sp. TaxID=1506 RepID=UPI003EE566EC
MTNYQKELIIYYYKLFKYYLFNISVPLTILLGGIFIVKDLTFAIVGSMLINVLRWYVDDAYHCKTLFRCYCLTNFMFISCGLLVPHISTDLAIM